MPGSPTTIIIIIVAQEGEWGHTRTQCPTRVGRSARRLWYVDLAALALHYQGCDMRGEAGPRRRRCVRCVLLYVPAGGCPLLSALGLVHKRTQVQQKQRQ